MRPGDGRQEGKCVALVEVPGRKPPGRLTHNARVLRRAARAIGLGAAILLAAAGAAPPGKGPSSKSPHVEITAKALVETLPRIAVHKNGRKFLEFEVTLDAYFVAAEQPAGADRNTPVDMQGRVKVVHDLSCGGDALALAPGDRVELLGEYVDVPGGRDVIHFTHAADAKAGCGSGGGHPAGYLRKVAPVTPTPVVTPPRPANIVPDQPWVGTPAAGEKPYAAIVRMKQAGASEEKLLEAVRATNKRYALTTAEIQQLRAEGISPRVIEAMIQSGAAVTPGVRYQPSPTFPPR